MDVNRVAEGRLLRAGAVAARLGVSVRTVWRLCAAGSLPQPLRLTRRAVRWREHDIDEYVDRLSHQR
jgi:excisionase family DNA binding protein